MGVLRPVVALSVAGQRRRMPPRWDSPGVGARRCRRDILPAKARRRIAAGSMEDAPPHRGAGLRRRSVSEGSVRPDIRPAVSLFSGTPEERNRAGCDTRRTRAARAALYCLTVGVIWRSTSAMHRRVIRVAEGVLRTRGVGAAV